MEADVRISSWDELCAHLLGKGVRLPREASSATIDVPTGSRPWPVTLRVVDVFGTTWLEVTGTVGEARFASPQAMLVDSSGLAIGALCVGRDGSVMLRQHLPLDGLRAADLDDVLAAVAAQAAKAAVGLERHASPP